MFLIDELIALLAANLILSQALGTSTMFIAADSKKNMIATSCVITVFTTLGSAAAYLIDSLLPTSAADLRLLFYTAVIGILYIIMLTVSYFAGRKWFADFRKYIHVSAFNCAVMGTLFTISGRAEDYSIAFDLGGYVFAGFEAGLGFIVAALILAAAYRKLNSAKVPASFRGFPAMLVYLGIISMAVYSLK
ncbi:Rnf-Nqr domain containing protein [Ruminococcus flavefaciens]|uniref:Rnf-Nqr domain containing protein n=1 Tax=Ruminococcus flavefaciens TaxID=1265 RepID=UPI00046599D8|nr:Rnf-Nqr domain containing protein [Ruminococcus flavefaciens]